MLKLKAQVERITKDAVTVVQDAAFLEREGAGAAFDPPVFGPNGEITKQGRIILGDNPTYYQFVHEVLHLEHYTIQPALFATAGMTESQVAVRTIMKEQSVFQKLTAPPLWQQLNELEQADVFGAFSRAIAKAQGKGASGIAIGTANRMIDETRRRLAVPKK